MRPNFSRSASRLLVWSLLLTVLFLTSLSPRAASASEPQALHRFSDDRLPPPGARTNLILTGAAMFALSYGPALGASYIWPETPGAADLRIPIVGPWIKLGKTRLCDDVEKNANNCQDAVRVIGAVLAAVDGIAQGGSVFLLLESIFMSTAPLTSNSQSSAYLYGKSSLGYAYSPGSYQHDSAASTALFTRGDFRFNAAPYSDQNVDLGLGFSGTF